MVSSGIIAENASYNGRTIFSMNPNCVRSTIGFVRSIVAVTGKPNERS